MNNIELAKLNNNELVYGTYEEVEEYDDDSEGSAYNDEDY